MTSKTPDEHRRQHAAMNHDTTRAVIKLLRLAGLVDDANALEESQARVWQPIGMRTKPGEIVQASAEVPAQLTPEQKAFRKPPAAPTDADYERGKAPSIMDLAAELRAEKNADRRLPPERDE